MRSITVLMIMAALVSGRPAVAQKRIKAQPLFWTAHNSQATFKKGVIHLVNTTGRTAFLWLNNTSFRNGIIELDLKGKDVRGESFIGVAFHSNDTNAYDAVYFRPFNFKDPERKARSVQYVSFPGNDWDVLREDYPGTYEAMVNPVPDPNGWFHARIVIQYPKVSVYIEGAREPSLVVEKRSKTPDGKLGLWIDCKEGWFRDIVITEAN